MTWFDIHSCDFIAFHCIENVLTVLLLCLLQVYNELHSKVKEAVIALVSMAFIMCIYLWFLSDSRSNIPVFISG